MVTKKPDIIYSEPVKELMGNPPSGILRWGNVVLFSAFVLFILFAWIIKYPDTIPSPVEITTVNPPVTLVTKITGRIRYLYVDNKDSVYSGQLLAVMETAASVNEIELLKKTIDEINKPEDADYRQFPPLSQLGELQIFYASFLKNLNDLSSFISNDYYGNKIISITREIDAIGEYINRLKVKEKLYEDNRKLEISKYRRDSLLFINSVIPENEYEKSHQALIRINIELQQVRLDNSEKSIELAEKHQMLQDYTIRRIEEKEKLISALNESFLILKAEIRIWENNYLLRSPFDGFVTFTHYWTENQVVMKDEPVLNIVPHETGSYLGRINLKMQRSGKVKSGQIVNIKLSSYPYLEYGMVRGIIKSKSLVTSGDAYVIEIDFPDGLKTLYGINLEFTQNMSGTAEIVTEDLRLLQKLVNPFRYLVTRNKR
jgi:HlyD family secretion protein